MAPIKKSRQALNLSTKKTILDQLDNGVKASALAGQYNVTKSAISKIKSKKSEILSVVRQQIPGSSDKKTLSKGEHPELETMLYSWFLEQRKNNVMVDGHILRTKAAEIFESDKNGKGETFKASDGWLSRFKQRYGLKFSRIDGEMGMFCQTELDDIVKSDATDENEGNLMENVLIEIEDSSSDDDDMTWNMPPEGNTFATEEMSEAQRFMKLFESAPTGTFVAASDIITSLECNPGFLKFDEEFDIFGESSNEEIVREDLTICHYKAVEACGQILTWANKHMTLTYDEYNILENIRQSAINMSFDPKQRFMTDFFKKIT